MPSSRRVFLRNAAAGLGLGWGGGNLEARGDIERSTAIAGLDSADYPRVISLNGIWNYRPLARTVITANGSIVDGTSNLPPGGAMPVPSNWQLHGLPGFNGRVRFSRNFDFLEPLGLDDRVFLVFHGVDYFTDVELNGEFLGRHEGYFQAFEFDVTRQLRHGPNSLAVTVDAPLEEKGTVFPHQKRLIKGVLLQWIWNPGCVEDNYERQATSAGIWNCVELEIRRRAWVDHVKIEPVLYEKANHGSVPHDEDFDANVFVSAELHAVKPGNYQVSFAAGGVRVSSSFALDARDQAITLVLPLDHPRLWWTWELGEPYVYNARIVVTGEDRALFTRRYNFGVRRIELDEQTGQWKLNGVRFFMRGTNVIPDLWLAHYVPERIAQDVRLLRNCHINGVRVCVHVNRHELYDALDRAGIVAWQEFPLQWNYTSATGFIENAASQLRDMICQFYNHPSIGAWVCQNEARNENLSVLDPFLAEVGRQEDSSRPVRPVSDFREHIYEGWYRGNYRSYACAPRGPIISELGAQALPSVKELQEMIGNSWPPDMLKLTYYGLEYDPTFHVAQISMGSSLVEFIEDSQHYQATLLKFAIEHYRRAKYRKLGTFFQFMFMDLMPAISWSVLTYDRRAKAGYDALRRAYQPVLIGADLTTSRWTKGRYLKRNLFGILGGSPIEVTPWLVNDLREGVRGASYDIALKHQTHHILLKTSDGDVELDADSVKTLPSAPYRVPADLPVGNYELMLTLRQGAQVLSENSYPVSVVD